MAYKKANSPNSSMELIMKLRDIRNTVRDERIKRLGRESSSNQRVTYHSGQVAARTPKKSTSSKTYSFKKH